MVFSYLKDKTAVAELFREVSPKVGERPGGYTRILKTGNRIGDNAEMCILELVDYNEAMLGGEKLQKPKQQEEEEHQRKKMKQLLKQKLQKLLKKKLKKLKNLKRKLKRQQRRTVPEE